MDKDILTAECSKLWNIIPKDMLFSLAPEKSSKLETLQSWMTLLPKIIANQIQFALDQKQPFMSNDVTTDLLLEKNSHLPTYNQLTLLYSILVYALEWEEYRLTSALIFIVDRASYRFGLSSQLFKILDFVLQLQPDTPSTPQVIIRKARCMKDTGDLHGANHIINSLENKEYKWDYKTNEQYINVKAVCVQIKGQIYHNLGLWREAIVPLVESTELFNTIKDNKGLSYSCGLLTRCLSKLTPDDFYDMKRIYPLFFKHKDPYYEGYQLSVKTVQIIKESSFSEALFMARHQLSGDECLLMYATQQEFQKDKYEQYEQIMKEIKDCLVILHYNVSSLNSSESFFEFIRSVFMISQILSFSKFPQEKKLAQYLELLGIELYGHLCFCKQADNFYQSVTSVKHMNGALTILGLPELDVAGVILKKVDTESEVDTFNAQTSSSRYIHLDKKSNTQPEMRKLQPDVSVQKSSSTVPIVEKGINYHFERKFVGESLSPEVFCFSDWSDSSESNEQKKDEKHPLVDISVTSLSDTASSSSCQYKLPNVGPLRSGDSKSNTSIADKSSELERNSSSEDASNSSRSSFEIVSAPNSHSDTSILSATTKRSTKESELSSDWEAVPLVDIEKQDVLDKFEDLDLGSSSSKSSSVEYLMNWKLPTAVESQLSSLITRAHLLTYNAVNGQWRPQSTLACIGAEVKLSDDKKGHFRDVYEVSFLHQDEPLGRYVCKRYRRQKPPVCYMQDVICQMVAGYYVTKFNDALINYNTPLRVQFLPVAHLQLLTSEGELKDWVNVEPFLHGTFNKLTNNWSFLNNEMEDVNAKDLATALSHFSYEESNGALMIVDIQGWLPRNKTGIIYLTDPQFHTSGLQKFSLCDHQEKGMEKFWKHVHTSCNDICTLLQLRRPIN